MFNPINESQTNLLNEEQTQQMKYQRALEIRRQLKNEKEAKKLAIENNEMGDDVINVNALGVSDVEGEANEDGFKRYYRGFFKNEELLQTDPGQPIDENQEDKG